MNILRKIVIALTATACGISAFSCSDSEKKGSSAESSSSSAAADSSSPVPEEGEFVTDPEEPDMGEYTVSENNTKLYYSPEDVPTELMSALETYFINYAETDFEGYKESIHPTYIEEMEKYLQKDFGYGIKESFEAQCENLRENAGGEFKVTRIKAESNAESNLEEYFSLLDDTFGMDFYGAVKEDCEKFHDLIFYVIVEAGGSETLLLSEFEIVFAEKDGKYYTFS